MNEKKFLQQMYTKLENQLEQEVKLADGSIEISESDKVIFRVDSKGDVHYSADKQYSNIVNKLHGKIENDVRNTKEFLKVMDNSPELTAVDLNAPYKKLLEYNDVVLAGTEHSNGSFEFVTWDCKNNSLDHGHYPDNLKSKAVMWLWELKDLGIIAVETLISILALTQTGIMIPLAVTAGYAVLSIRLDDTSIKQFIVNAWKYCVRVQQYYEWRYTDE